MSGRCSARHDDGPSFTEILSIDASSRIPVFSFRMTSAASTLIVMMLTKWQRNQIYQTIVESYLDAAECTLIVTDEKTIIAHTSGSRIEISEEEISSGTATWKYIVDGIVIDGNRHKFRAGRTADDLATGVRRWADEVAQVVEMPDHWVEMQRGRQLIASIQRGAGSAPFTQDEQGQIAAQLQEIKRHIRGQFELTNEQIAQVEEKLDEAAEASKRMGRKDWLLLFSGTIFTLIVTDIVTPGVAEHIFTMVIYGLIHLFTGGGEPPRIPP